MKTKRKILVVSHDAGGAEIVSAYVKVNRRKSNFFCFVSGPAIKIFRRKKIKNFLINNDTREEAIKILEKFKDADVVLVGTGWGSSIELDFIQAAKKRGTKTVAYLDHWVNYRERFGYPKRDWRRFLPDEIWVGDSDAFLLAKKLFSGYRVRMVSNSFFKEIKKEYKKAKKRLKKGGHAILFATEPVSAASLRFRNKNHDLHVEEKILEIFLDCLLKIGWNDKVIIRYHPSESGDKYKKIIKKYIGKLKIERSIGRNMYDDLAKSRCVVGMKSMFLAVATLTGKKVVSFLPGNRGRCPLPGKYIIKVKSVKNLGRVLLKECL